MDQTDYFNLISAMREFLDPDGPWQKKILQALSIDPVALRIVMERPAPDGDFEILFVSRDNAEQDREKFLKYNTSVDIIPFAEGMRLAQRSDCCGGPYSFREGQKLIALNPALRDENGAAHYVM